MRKATAALAGLALAIALSLGLAACGDDGGEAEGGSITISQTSQPDSLDPALAGTVESWEALWLVYTPLLTYRHEEGQAGSELIPGLAESMPQIGDGGTTYELTLRDGVRYSDGTPVRASDFEHTIKRVLNLESPGSSYFEGIEGAEAFVKAGDQGADIPGIETDDETGEITITLSEPDATFSNVLATVYAGLVPGDTPFQDMTSEPPPGVGTYEIAESVPNRRYVLKKSPHFDAGTIPGVPDAKIATITARIVPNLVQQTQDVIENRLDYMQDPPAADLKAEVIERFGPEGSEEQRYEEFTTLSTYFFFMNVTLPPFDDIKVREAVNIGLDKPALARLYAGGLQPGCSFLPPGMPGYTEAIDQEGCPWDDPTEPPDLERAKRLIRDAGAEGAEVTVWGNSDEPTPEVTQAYADQLNEIGLDAQPKILNGAVYFETVGDQSTEAQTGFSNWFADFPHPAAFFPVLDGRTVEPAGNVNLGLVDDQRISEEIAALSQEPQLGEVTDRWEELNEYAVERAYLAPYGHIKLATFVSDRIDFEDCTLVHPVFQNDYSSFCLKGGE